MSILALPSVGIAAAAAAADLLPAVAFAKLSGEDDPHRLADIAAHDLAARDLLFTFSVMCSPANPEDWLRLNNALTDDELYHAIRHAERLGIPSSVKGDVALGIADREELRSILDQMFAKDWLGHVASGYILRWIISRWQNPATKNDASLTRAASIIEEWCKQQCIAGGGSQNLVRYLWPKYKSVSHLWAAFYIAQDIGVNLGTPTGVLFFFGTAEWLLSQAVSIVPKGRRHGEAIISHDEAWRPPPSHVPMAKSVKDGESALLHWWIEDLDAHDLRKAGGPPFLKPV